LSSDAAFSTTTLSWLSLLALVVSVLAVILAVAVAVAGRRRTRSGPRGLKRSTHDLGPMSSDEVTARIEALQAVADTSLRHLAVVRYDAFGDMGGHLSWSMALLDDSGDGVVLTSIHGRSDSRTYAKNVTAWTASQQLSPEEEEAIGFARSPGSPG
jgi:hypothetical protein